MGPTFGGLIGGMLLIAVIGAAIAAYVVYLVLKIAVRDGIRESGLLDRRPPQTMGHRTDPTLSHSDWKGP